MHIIQIRSTVKKFTEDLETKTPIWYVTWSHRYCSSWFNHMPLNSISSYCKKYFQKPRIAQFNSWFYLPILGLWSIQKSTRKSGVPCRPTILVLNRSSLWKFFVALVVIAPGSHLRVFVQRHSCLVEDGPVPSKTKLLGLPVLPTLRALCLRMTSMLWDLHMQVHQLFQHRRCPKTKLKLSTWEEIIIYYFVFY